MLPPSPGPHLCPFRLPFLRLRILSAHDVVYSSTLVFGHTFTILCVFHHGLRALVCLNAASNGSTAQVCALA